MVRQVPFPNPLPKILREQQHLVRQAADLSQCLRYL